MYGFSDEFCFNSAEELAKQGKIANAVINDTMNTSMLTRLFLYWKLDMMYFSKKLSSYLMKKLNALKM
jgi:hypothetical protein